MGKNMIYLKITSSEKGYIIAMCDAELIGKKFKDKKRELDLEKYADFYKGELISEDEAKNKLNVSFFTANIVGKRSIDIVINKGLAKESDIVYIEKIPHIQLFRIEY